MSLVVDMSPMAMEDISVRNAKTFPLEMRRHFR